MRVTARVQMVWVGVWGRLDGGVFRYCSSGGGSYEV